MASTTLTEYELKRLDNIRRNGGMMASLKLQSMATDLTASTKGRRNANKPSTQKKPKNQAEIVARCSMRTRGMPPDSRGLPYPPRNREKTETIKPKPWARKLGPFSMRKAYGGNPGSDRALIEMIVRNGNKPETDESEFCRDKVCEFGEFGKGKNLSDLVKKEEGSFDLYSMILYPENVARIFPNRITHARFFPCPSSRIVVAGNNLGDVGFWNLDHQRDDGETKDGVYRYHSHPSTVTGISIHQHCLSKVFTSCYDGFIRLMDAEKEVFDLIYSSEYSIFTLCQRPNDAKCLYFGEASGLLNIWDDRMGKCSNRSVLHADRINSIDFNSVNPDVFATSCSDGNVCIWDLRNINANKPETLKTISHKRAAQSAYFSPSGKCLASTSLNNIVGIHSGNNFEETSGIQHYPKGRNVSPFRAIWGWDDSYIFIGNMKRGVDVISPSQRRTTYTLESPHIPAILWKFDVHPCNVGMLAGATNGGQVCVWTLS